MFERHRYPRVIILQAVYFKLRFTLSYRDVEELMSIRGLSGIEVVSIINKDQMINPCSTSFKIFCSLVA